MNPKGGIKGGPKTPGSGRVKGTPNKATVERKLAAEIDAARAGEKELGKDVLERAMRFAEGVVSLNRPEPVVVEGKVSGTQGGDWDRFGAWFDRWVFCAKELAKYQSPQLRAIAVAPMPALPEPKVIEGERADNVIDLQDAEVLSRIYQRRVQMVRG